MGKCSIVGCKNRNDRGRRIFSFPKDAAVRKKWLEICLKDEKSLGKNGISIKFNIYSNCMYQ